MSDLIISDALESDMELLISFADQMKLDTEGSSFEQFITAKKNNVLAGFGRLKDHEDFEEICTLGIIEKFRKHTIGSLLVKTLIQKTSTDLYLVTLIPSYFEKLGFKVAATFPASLNSKISLCSTTLHQPGEKPVVMKYNC